MRCVFCFFLLFLASGCCRPVETGSDLLPKCIEESPYFLVILVDAPHLNYSSTLAFLRSVANRASGQKIGRFGHAWIYLQGLKDGKPYIAEGGHSGELGIVQPTYFDGIMNYNIWGYANPTPEQKKAVRYEPNPVKYLWMIQKDGFFQKGSGGHKPTFAVKVVITREQFEKIVALIENRYSFEEYSLTSNQCSSFVSQAASLACLPIEGTITVPIDKKVFFGGRTVRLREDSPYAFINLATPDVIEQCLSEAVKAGKAEYAPEFIRFR